MTTETPRFEMLLEAFAKLGVPKHDTVLIGSSVLAVRGLRDVNDLDVLVTPEWFEKLQLMEGAEVHGEALAFAVPDMIQISTHIHSFAAKSGLTTHEIWRDANWWEGWLVMSLHHLKRFKQAVGREKDHADLHLLGSLV